MPGETPSTISRNDHTSPFFLGSQDRPGDLITPVRLRNNNYDEWARSVRLALLARRKFGFVDGTIMKPEAPFTQEDWLTIHSMLVSWLMHTIDPEVRSTISFYDDAKILWDELKTRFSVTNGPKMQQLKTDIVRCEQSKTMTAAAYFGKLKVLWDDLANHEPIIVCKCGKCTCNLGKVHEKRRDNERLHQFLMGLNSEYYSQLRSNLLSQEPLPTLDHVYQQITQEEQVRGFTRAKEYPPEVAGFAVRPEGRGKGRPEKIDKSGLMCSHCHRSGHDTANCFQLLGYPEWWGDRPRTQGIPSTRGKSGGGRGSDSGQGKGAKIHAVTVDTNNSGTSSTNHQASSSTPAALPNMSPKQWQTIAALFGNIQSSNNSLHGKFSKNSWIIDTGASNHATGNFSYLFDVKDIAECLVRLPNGRKIAATKEGSVIFSKELCLKNVLYVPDLDCDLISVTQLLDDMNCSVHFFPSMCVLQDLHSRKLIGTGERRDGLYYYRQATTVHATTVDSSSSSLELWHQRLGHPSEKVVKLLPFFHNTRDKLSNPCDVCPRAKQCRDSFPISNNKTS